MMDRASQDQAIQSFEATHGQSLWRGGWGYTADGCEIEAGMFGYRFLTTRPPERQHEVKILYWKFTLENATSAFHTLKDRLATKAEQGTLTAQDTKQLEALREQVQAAAHELDLLENPPGADPRDVRKAKKLYLELRQLLADVNTAEARYHDALARLSGKGEKLEAAWAEAWDRWDIANRAYQGLPEDVRKQAEAELWEEQEREKRKLQKMQLDEIEV